MLMPLLSMKGCILAWEVNLNQTGAKEKFMTNGLKTDSLAQHIVQALP